MAVRVSDWIASTFWLISSVAREVSSASSLTSLATTAKPLPASPARAASMVALRASRLVCWAMVLITCSTLSMSELLLANRAITSLVVLADSTAPEATRAASAALREIS